MSERRACSVIGADRTSIRYRSRRPDDHDLRERLRALASERRRFGYRRLHVLLRREGHVVNRKKTQRLYCEEGLSVRKRRGRKKATGTRAPLLTVAAPNARWSVHFVHDQFAQGRRFRIFNVIDDVTKECLAAVVDTSISGRRVARELTALIARRGRPGLIVSDHVLCREIWLLRSADHGASGVPDALIRLPRRALPSRNDLFHSKHRVRALAALTVLNTRSQIPSRRPEHYLRGQQAASTARQREVLPPGLTPSKKGR